MKRERLTLILTVVNTALLAIVLARGALSGPRANSPVVRARGLELVDDAGQIRGQFTVEPGGEAVFRLRETEVVVRVEVRPPEPGRLRHPAEDRMRGLGFRHRVSTTRRPVRSAARPHRPERSISA
jgi:hypothetical protein